MQIFNYRSITNNKVNCQKRIKNNHSWYYFLIIIPVKCIRHAMREHTMWGDYLKQIFVVLAPTLE